MRSAAVHRMRLPVLFVLCYVGPAAAGCAGSQVASVARLRVVAVPDTATVELEERFFAPARALREAPAALPPGLHLVTVRAPGYFPHDLEVVLEPGLTTLEVSLRRLPD